MIQKTLSPIDGSVVVERPYATRTQIASALSRAQEGFALWRHTPLQERISLCRAAMDWMLARKEELGREITLQMGRPIRYTPNEISGMADRASYMCDIAEENLADILIPEKSGFQRYIRREPLGTVFAIVPWNYPYLTAINTVIPALLAGNVVILKHSPHTPLCSERLVEAFNQVGLPAGIFQFLHLSNEDADRLVKSPEVDYVAFTGSVSVGRTVQKAASGRFIGVGLELGGKDPAFVRSDADLPFAIENLVDGAFFNSGQSCCAIERIYVHEDLYEAFVEGAVDLTNQYVLGNPLDPKTTLGPMIGRASAAFVRSQTADALRQGASYRVDESRFPRSHPETAYLAPQILTDVDHSMSVMREESFGPVVGIMKVQSDQEAIQLMNDTRFGLTASVWTSDPEMACEIGDQVRVGTWFMNRCDYLDPALAWAGTGDSGRGCTLSKLGFDPLTRPKSFHLRLPKTAK